MKLSFGSAIIILALFFNVLFVTEAKAQVLTDILKRMQAHQKALFTLRTKLTMEQYNVQLGETDLSEGTLVYARSAKIRAMLRVDWTKPRSESLSLINNRFILYSPSLKQAFVGDLNKTKGNRSLTEAISIFNTPVSRLKADYDIQYLGQAAIKGGIRTMHLKITPKKRTSLMSTTEFWVDKDGMPLLVRVTQPNQDSATILFSDLRKNAPVTAAVFSIKLPANTKIINTSATAFPDIKTGGRTKALKAKKARRVRARKNLLPSKRALRTNKIRRRAAR